MGDPSIRDMTNQLNQIAANNPDDFRFAPEDARNCVAEIENLESAISGAKSSVQSLGAYGNVGGFPSAIATRDNLQGDVHDLEKMLDDYLAYLGAFKNAVQQASGNLQAADSQ